MKNAIETFRKFSKSLILLAIAVTILSGALSSCIRLPENATPEQKLAFDRARMGAEVLIILSALRQGFRDPVKYDNVMKIAKESFTELSELSEGVIPINTIMSIINSKIPEDKRLQAAIYISSVQDLMVTMALLKGSGVGLNLIPREKVNLFGNVGLQKIRLFEALGPKN